jgi:hypothetical protein
MRTEGTEPWLLQPFHQVVHFEILQPENQNSFQGLQMHTTAEEEDGF